MTAQFRASMASLWRIQLALRDEPIAWADYGNIRAGGRPLELVMVRSGGPSDWRVMELRDSNLNLENPMTEERLPFTELYDPLPKIQKINRVAS